jgi:hypothetical protein
VGGVRLRLVGEGTERGIVGWSVRDLGGDGLDGLPTTLSESPVRAPAPAHPNGAVAIDHVVAFSPALDRTVEALRGAGLDLRRMREGPTPGGSTRQAFFRMGEVILEVIQAPEGSRAGSDPSGSAGLWGLAFLVEDLDECARVVGERLGEPRDAVQPGRRIAPVRSSASLGAAVAFITPGPGAA